MVTKLGTFVLLRPARGARLCNRKGEVRVGLGAFLLSCVLEQYGGVPFTPKVLPVEL